MRRHFGKKRLKRRQRKIKRIRAFVSIDIPKNIQNEIVKIQKQLPFFQGRLTAPENMHLTLKFLGDIDREILIEVKRRLKEIKFENFETKISGIGIFDNRNSRKYNQNVIVWLRMTSCGRLQKKIDEKLSGLGNLRKERRFMGHLTIARARSIKNKNRFTGELRKIKIPLLKFEVENFNLKKSELTHEGPIYKIIESYDLD